MKWSLRKKKKAVEASIVINMEDLEKYDYLISKTQYPFAYLVRLGSQKIDDLYHFYRAQEDAMYLIQNQEALSQWPLPWHEESFSYFIQRTVSLSSAAILFYISNIHEGLPLQHIVNLYAPFMK